MDINIAKGICLAIFFVIPITFGTLPLCLVCRCKFRFNDSQRGKSILSYLNCFAGGVFLATCLLALMTKGKKEFEDYKQSANIEYEFPFFEVGIGAGFFLVAMIEKIAHRLHNAHPHEDDENGRQNAKVSGEDRSIRQEAKFSEENGDSRKEAKVSEHKGSDRQEMIESGEIQPKTAEIKASSEPTAESPTQSSTRKSSVNGQPVEEILHVPKTRQRDCNTNSNVLSQNTLSGSHPHTYVRSGLDDSSAFMLRQNEKCIYTAQASDRGDEIGEEHHHSFSGQNEEAARSELNLEGASGVSGLRVALLMLAMSFHTVFDGLAVGLQTRLGALWSVLGAVVIHKTIVSICLGSYHCFSP